MRRAFRRLMPWAIRRPWYVTWDRPPHLTSVERSELRRRRS